MKLNEVINNTCYFTMFEPFYLNLQDKNLVPKHVSVSLRLAAGPGEEMFKVLVLIKVIAFTGVTLLDSVESEKLRRRKDEIVGHVG